jgi:hypothetical protein
MFSRCGVEKDAAQEILQPLIDSTAENLRSSHAAKGLDW